MPVPSSDQLTLEVWADAICPWCYIGKRRLEAALAALGDARERVRVVWHSFELGQQNRSPEQTAAELLVEMWGERGQARIEHIRALGAAEGLELNLDLARPVQTFDAHRVTQLAAAHDRADAFVERLLRAYHTEGLHIGDANVLAGLAAEAGLDRATVREALAGDAWAAEVRADERRAAQRGVSGVPTLSVADGPLGSGVRSPAELLEIVQDGLARLDAGFQTTGRR